MPTVLVVVLALIVLASLLAVGAPMVLSRGAWRLRFPRLALTLWFSAFAGGLLAAAAGLTLSVAAASFLQPGETDVRGWGAPTVLVLVGWGGLAAVGAVIALIASRAEPANASDRILHQQMTLLAARYPSRVVAGVDVVFVPSDEPLALSVASPSSRIVVTSCLAEALTADQLRAVIEHERTHLTQRHAFLTRLAQLNRACSPRLPGAQHLQRTTHLLVELIADDAAAKRVGAVDTANALIRMAKLRGDDSMALRARRIADRANRSRPRRRYAPRALAWHG